MNIHETYMHRCIELAKLGNGNVAPNPMVGAVLVHEGRIIGEGYHKKFGQSHAEVNCINSVSNKDNHLISSSILYVSLEPCAHYGKTPPCADLIIEKQIPTVVIGCRDTFEDVNGKGIEKLQQASIVVTVGVLEDKCRKLNKRFFTFHKENRPYIILKWAQTANGKIAPGNKERLLITNEFTNRLVHKWRSAEMGILVGTNTVMLDNPELTNRLWNGSDPVRLVLDLNLKLPESLKVFDQKYKTVIFNLIKHEEKNNLIFYKLTNSENIVHQILKACKQINLQSILVEGGAQLLQSFINEGLCDEAQIITNCKLQITNGLDAPVLSNFHLQQIENIFDDTIEYYTRKNK